MFYLSISTKALKKAIEHAKANLEKQALGFLIGRMEGYTLVVEDAITDEVESSKTSSRMSPVSIAKIANEIIHQKIPGNIVGWYHSHPGYDVYMSKIDAETQSKLQQFSPYIVALVIDPSSDKKRFFTLDPKTKSLVTISDDYIHYFNSEGEAIPPKFEEPPKIQALPPIPMEPSIEKNRAGIPSKQLYLIIIVLLCIGLLITGTFLVISIVSGGGLVSAGLKVEHTPIKSGIIGTNIPIQAKVTGGTGGIQNVTLYYRVIEENLVGSWKEVSMLLVAAGGDIYEYNIPSNEVSGQAIDYYIISRDKAGNAASEPIRTISVADFELEALEEIEPITVYAGKSVDTKIRINSINGFESSIKLSAPERPAGVSVSYPASVTPPKGGSTTVNLRITAISGAPTGKYQIRIEGKYGSITRSLDLDLIVSDFEITVTPLSAKISKGETAEYTIVLNIYEGFKDKISFSVEGLPLKDIEETDFVLVNKELIIPGKTIVLLKIDTKSSISSGTYTLIIKAAGGGLVHDERLTLII
ncbi:MAG: hypothetical protein QW265_00390 [Candidatus Bathyarchaeia archaeon]